MGSVSMSSSNRQKAAWSIVLLSAVALGASLAHGQVDAQDGDLWPNCTARWLIDEQHHVGSHFSVRVSFRGEAISGARVSLTSDDPLPNEPGRRVIATRRADAKGAAHFFGIAPGLYQAHVDEGLLAPVEEIEVAAADNATDDEVGIEWPQTPIAAQTLQGWITSWQKDSPQNRSRLLPLKNVLIQLLDLRTGKLLASTHTSEDGYYDFPRYGDGLYVVRVNETRDPSTNSYDEAVEVAGDAPGEHMPGLELDRVCGRGLVLLQDGTDRKIAVAKPEAVGGPGLTK